MICAQRIDPNHLDDVLVTIASMDRQTLIDQFHTYPAPFPIDFSDDFLEAQPIDRLRHVFAGLVMHCRIVPEVR